MLVLWSLGGAGGRGRFLLFWFGIYYVTCGAYYMMCIMKRCLVLKCLRCLRLLFLDLSWKGELYICSYVLTRLTRKYYMPHCIAFFSEFCISCQYDFFNLTTLKLWWAHSFKFIFHSKIFLHKYSIKMFVIALRRSDFKNGKEVWRLLSVLMSPFVEKCFIWPSKEETQYYKEWCISQCI